ACSASSFPSSRRRTRSSNACGAPSAEAAMKRTKDRPPQDGPSQRAIVASLETAAAACDDAAQSFRGAAEHVASAELKSTWRSIAEDHEKDAKRLREVTGARPAVAEAVRELGGAAREALAAMASERLSSKALAETLAHLENEVGERLRDARAHPQIPAPLRRD